jgi:hypothetical protein
MNQIRAQPPINWIYYSYEFEGNMSKALSSLKYYCNGCNKPGSLWPRKDRKWQEEWFWKLRWAHKCGHSNCLSRESLSLWMTTCTRIAPGWMGQLLLLGTKQCGLCYIWRPCVNSALSAGTSLWCTAEKNIKNKRKAQLQSALIK